MQRKKKPVCELTSEQLAKRLFPAKVVREAKKIAHEKDLVGEKNDQKSVKRSK